MLGLTPKLQTARTEWDLVALNEEFVALSLLKMNGIPSVVCVWGMGGSFSLPFWSGFL